MVSWRGVTAGMLPMLLLTAACTGAGPPKPPLPQVSTVEFEHRLDEHLARVTTFLRPEAEVSAPVHSRQPGCAGGPAWSVTPRAEVTVRSDDHFFTDLQFWLAESGFAGLFENESPGPNRSAQGRHADGSTLVERRQGEAEFTVTVTGPCTWPPDRPGGPPAGRLAPLGPTAPPRSWNRNSAISGQFADEVCRSPKLYVYNSEARPATGPGPHPMDLDTYADDRDLTFPELSLPVRTGAAKIDEVQLAVCVRVRSTGATGRKITCLYRDPGLGDTGVPHHFRVHNSVYQITVRSARTGAIVRRLDLPGTQSDRDSCPFWLEDSPVMLARGLDEKALARVLRSLHDGHG